MKEKINIADILKDKPVNTKLYSPLYGDVYLSHIGVRNDINVLHHSALSKFLYDGRYAAYKESEILLFPSKEMQDWSRFAWKKGDVLVTEDGSTKVIFECFEDDTYLTFKGKYCLQKTNIDETFIVDTKENLTECFSLQAKNIAQIYIHNIEDRMGGILNMETLEIEKAQPEFKDWDFITIKLPRGSSLICVFKAENDENYYLHASLNSRGMITINENSYCSKSGCIVRLSTEEEKTAFFDALARKGKIWDVEKKKIIALKKKWTPKPFDRVITRNDDDDIWTANIFSHMDSHGEYVTIGCVGGYTYCIPYNEVTAKLIGTTKDVEG